MNRRGPKPRPILDRLMHNSRREGDCLIFTGWCNVKGYGSLTVNAPHRRTVFTHRLMWEILNGPIPAETPFVLHSCDNPPCMEITHLSLGTNSDNMRDMVSKGRNRGPLVRTHCKRDHELTESNVYVTPSGYQRCKRCHADAELRHRGVQPALE